MIHPTKTKLARRITETALILSVVCLASIAVAQSGFDDMREKLSLATGTHPESEIAAMLKTGLAEDKPTQALALTERWLRQNSAQDPLLLYRAGQAAELAGDWPSAVALYRQFLKRADLQSDIASDAILGSYTLQINHLDAPEAAYAFAKTDGNDLVANAQARQFDRWFLDEAKRRRDMQAVASRLLALADAKVGDDLLLALYESDFRWLLNSINDGRLDQARYSDEFIETVKLLAKSTTFDKEFALLLDWSVSVKAYHMAILAEEQVSPPLAEARSLLSAHPHYASFVQLGWAGGNRSPHYRGDASKYWPLDNEAKLEPVRVAVAKLDPMDQAEYYQSLAGNYYSGRPRLLDTREVYAWVLANPNLVNSKIGPELDFQWHSIKHEDAKQLAPHLSQNPSPEAAGIRALASVNNIADELDKAIDTLIKQESWRLAPTELPAYIDRLWHHAGRPGGSAKRDQLIALSKPIQEQFSKSTVTKEDSLDKRLAQFRKLWQDYRSKQPKIPGVQKLLMNTLTVTPEAIAEVLKDPSIEAQKIAREAIDGSFLSNDAKLQELYHYARLSTSNYNPTIRMMASRYGSYDLLKQRSPESYKPHPLHAPLEAALSGQLKKNQVQPWLVLAWMNATFIEKNNATVKLMADLLNSPSWKAMPYEVRYAARDWFAETVLTPGQLAILQSSDVQKICQPLIELAEDADSATAAAALKTAMDGLKQSPVRHEIVGLDRLGKLNAQVISDPQVQSQLGELAGPMRSFTTDHTTTYHWFKILAAEREPGALHKFSAYLWRDVEVHHRLLSSMIELSEQMVDINPSAAHALARIGLQTIARHKRGHTYYNRDSDIPRLNAIRGKAAVAMKLVDIPVPPNHPAYPIYQSQSEYLIGNTGTARQLYYANAEQLIDIHRQLSAPYLLWVLQSTIDNREEDRQEELVKALLAWVQESPGAFTVEQRIALDLAYGDIALQRGMLPEAQQIYARARNNEAYAASFDRHEASLRLVRVQRIARDFDAALQTLIELDSEKVPRLTTEAHFARAEVFYDMEEYQDAADEIEKVLERDTEHADAKILQGRVYLKRQKLIEATEVELGSTTKLPSLVPGQMLKVTLNDPTLAVSSGSSDIEVVVWATSGDKEFLLLRQFGDQKTKYRGDVRTALAAPTPDDGVLQVVGDDEVYYAYSERFRKKMVNLEENRGGPIQVASDAILMASARKLLSENEQRVADMQRLAEMLDSNRDRNLERTNPERYAALMEEAERRNRIAMLETRVKPGNPIHLRVIDPDRGRTADIDELPVSVSTSSGDIVARVILKETDPYSGQFEGQVQTTAAQAIAFASSSESGRNPNMVISPKSGYPAWRPVENHEATPHFTVDLNDNAEIGQMSLIAKEQGSSLKAFVVQTGTSIADMTTVAVYPNNMVAVQKPWHPSVAVINDTDAYHNVNKRSVYDLHEIQSHMALGWITQQYPAGAADNVKGISEAFTPDIPGRVEWKRQNRHHNSHVIYRFRGYFYEPVSITRKFKLELGNIKMPDVHPSVADPAQYLIAVNGRPITNRENPNQLEGSINLSPGVHMFEIWATGWDCRIGFGRSVKLFANLDDEEVLIECPDNFFDPAAFPEGVIDHRNTPANVTASNDGKSFNVDFASGSRTRLIRILFVDQEGTVPTLNQVTLNKPGGEVLLPVPEDFTDLRKNEVLEIVTGDQVAVRYLDDRFVTDGKQRHERLLNVAFTDAEIEFADIEPKLNEVTNEAKPYREKLLRFALNQPLPIVVHDADMDETTEPDTLTVSIKSGSGQTQQITATETGPSTGTFRAWITPVAQTTQAQDQIQVDIGGTLSATYLDNENLKPGVPYERVVTIKHGAFTKPRIEIAHATIVPYEEDPVYGARISSLNEDQQSPYWARLDGKETSGELIKTRFTISQRYRGIDEATEDGLAVVHGRFALIDIIAPHMALGEAATVEVYVQTDSGRQKSPKVEGAVFDVNVPGTLVYTGVMNSGAMIGHQTRERGGYIANQVDQQGSEFERARRSQEEGRFRLTVPLITGLTPSESYSDREAFFERSRGTGERYPHGLVAKAGEQIHVGLRYKDADNKTQWVTASARVIAMPMLDVMREDYRETLTEAYVGEKLFVRVVDPFEDRSPQRDEVRVYMQTKSGQKHYASLSETDFNSGIFKGVFQLTFAEAQDVNPNAEGYDVGRMGMPVQYGDIVGIRYTDAKDRKTDPLFVAVAKGSDGTIAPFSKQYDDAETAMRTQFAMAESYLELARRHRSLGEEDAAKHEFQRARQLLANTVAQFTDPETRAHAEYLLGNLTMEDAEATEDKELQAERYQAALARYMKVTGTYPDTAFASQAQFKTAVIYERLDEPDIAAQEYVKLAYKYPDSEYLATSMARLGTHFQRKAVEYERLAKPLLADEKNKDDFFEGTALAKLSKLEYIKAAQIFERLQERFPSHELAGTAGLRAGQIYMRAEDLSAAVKALESVFNNESYDGPTLRCEAMYWAGRCHVMKREDLLAYSLFKRITYDFPESKWAAYARSQLSSEQMLNLDKKLEIERLEAGQ